MEKFVLGWIMIFMGLNSLFADNVKNFPQTIEQPNGEVINCFTTGDEFYHWLHDAKGYTIVLNPDDGFFYYGIREGEEVVPSKYIVNSVDPSSVGLTPNAVISSGLYQKRKSLYTMPMKSFKDAPTTGQVNNLVVYIGFADDSVFKKPRSYYKPFFSHEDSASLKDYFREVSYNRLFVDTYHYPESPDTTSIIYIDEKPRGYFLKKSSSNPDGYIDSQSASREHALLKRAIESVRSQIPDTLNIDMNDDGRVDNICFVMQGPRAGWSDLLWPHRWAMSSVHTTINGKRVWDYLLMLEGGFEVGTLVHEFFHVLGAPDLYHYNPPEDNIKAVGRWDVMDENANPPQYMGAFMKYKYGDWIPSLPEITESGTYTIFPLSHPDQNVYKIKSPLSSSEYFVVEYRKREGRYESSAPGTGLVVYRINPNAGRGNAGGPPDEIYVYRPGGTLTNAGTISSAAFGREGRKAINDNTNPSSFLYNNGNGGRGGLDIFNVSSAGDSITFDINITTLYPPTQLNYVLDDEKVSLDWHPSYVPGLKNYIVYRNGQNLATVNATEYDDNTLEEGETYYYYVTAVYEGVNNGESGPSNEISITTLGVIELPYMENFEDAGHGWAIKGTVDGFRWGDADFLKLNTDNETRFLLASSIAAGQNAYTLDHAISPRLNLSGQERVTLEFDYSLKVWLRYDKLTVRIRRSKSDSWVSIAELEKTGIGPKYLWRHMSIDLPADAYTSEAQIGFRYSDSNEFAYGAAIDNISITANTTAVLDTENTTDVKIFPNPSSGRYVIELEGDIHYPIPMKVLGIDGREVWSETLNDKGILFLDLRDKADGIYHLLFEVSGQIVNRKLVKSSR